MERVCELFFLIDQGSTNYIVFRLQTSFAYKKKAVSCQKWLDVLKKFINFTGKHLCWRVFFICSCKSFRNIFGEFSRLPFYRTLPGDYLIQVKIAEFLPVYTINNYFTGTFPAFCTSARSSHSKVFISIKVLENYL